MLDPSEAGDDEGNLAIDGADYACVCHGAKVCDVCNVSIFPEGIGRKSVNVCKEDD